MISNAIDYINKNKKLFIEQFTSDIKPTEKKIAIFTAGMSGVGKTEFSEYLKENNSNLLHIDTDSIRAFFKDVGYTGQNSHIFQKPASKGFSKLFDYAVKKGFSLILDSNLSNISKAEENINRLLNKGYTVELFYFYNNPTICYEYAIKREVITNRKVPYDIFIKSNVDSFKTVIALKKLYNDKITLNFFDKRDDKLYQDIQTDKLIEIIGGHFDIK